MYINSNNYISRYPNYHVSNNMRHKSSRLF